MFFQCVQIYLYQPKVDGSNWFEVNKMNKKKVENILFDIFRGINVNTLMESFRVYNLHLLRLFGDPPYG